MAIDLIAIVGPTGIGKTALGIQLAKRIDGEIISADSRQIYRYLDIGTAKPTPQEQAMIPHHQIDIVDPDETYDAAQFSNQSREIITRLRAREKFPIVVGGSGLYVRSLIDGFFEGPPAQFTLRDTLSDKPLSVLYEELIRIDLESAKRIHPHDRKRIVRALEVYHATGQTLSEWHQIHQQQQQSLYMPLFVGLNRNRSDLYAKIEKRVDMMIESGLVDETKHILEMGYSPQLNALNTIGYKEIIAYLMDDLTLDDAVALMKKNSRRYAKRQLTWFRAEKRIVWFDVGEMVQDDILREIEIRLR